MKDARPDLPRMGAEESPGYARADRRNFVGNVEEGERNVERLEGLIMIP